MVWAFVPALAGSIPEDLLHSDSAQLFFAEVVYYHPAKENPDIEISPVKVIKGNVKTGVKLTYYNPNTVGDFKLKEGNVYLFAYFDEHNPTDIFRVTSYDTSKLKLVNISGDMWERFEKYLNSGEYEKAELERIDRQNKKLEKTGKTLNLTKYLEMDDVSAGDVSLYHGADAISAERNKFRKISDEIILEEIKTEDLKTEGGYGFHISVPESMKFAYVSSDGKVSRNNPDGDVLKDVEYVMTAADLKKIESLFGNNAEKLPPLVRIPVITVIVSVVIVAVIILTKYKTKGADNI